MARTRLTARKSIPRGECLICHYIHWPFCNLNDLFEVGGPSGAAVEAAQEEPEEQPEAEEEDPMEPEEEEDPMPLEEEE